MLRHNEEGYFFRTNKRDYELYQGFKINGDYDCTSDYVFIVTNEGPDPQIVGIVPGAMLLGGPYSDVVEKHISKIIKKYEYRN